MGPCEVLLIELSPYQALGAKMETDGNEIRYSRLISLCSMALVTDAISFSFSTGFTR
jgi:hypothetical protein